MSNPEAANVEVETRTGLARRVPLVTLVAESPEAEVWKGYIGILALGLQGVGPE